MQSIFKGVCTALVTPFKKGKVDFNALKNLIDYQLDSDIQAICVLGTTAEPCTLTEKEKNEIVKFCAKNKGRLKMIVGSGSNDTKKAIKQSVRALENGADALLVVTPYYNKCTQEGLAQYYKKIYDATKAPIIAYNVPSRTGVDILPQTLEVMAEKEYICAIKQANPNITQTLQMFCALRNKIDIYSGDDALNYLFYALGGSGAISVTANAFPRLVADVYQKYISSCPHLALAIQERLHGINKELFSQVNPIPIKYCLSYLGLCENEVRSPLTKMQNTKNLEKEVDNLLKI